MNIASGCAVGCWGQHPGLAGLQESNGDEFRRGLPLSSMLTGAAVVAAGTLGYGLRRILTDGPTTRQDDSTHH